MEHPEGRGSHWRILSKEETLWFPRSEDACWVRSEGASDGRGCETGQELARSRSGVREHWGRGVGNRDREKDDSIYTLDLEWGWTWERKCWWFLHDEHLMDRVTTSWGDEKKRFVRKVKSSPERWGLREVWVMMVTCRQMAIADNMGQSSEFQLELSMWDALAHGWPVKSQKEMDMPRWEFKEKEKKTLGSNLKEF